MASDSISVFSGFWRPCSGIKVLAGRALSGGHKAASEPSLFKVLVAASQPRCSSACVRMPRSLPAGPQDLSESLGLPSPPPFSYRDPPADLEPTLNPGSNFRILNLIMSAKTLFPGKATFRAPGLRTRTYIRNHSSALHTQQGVRDSFGGRVFCKGWQGCRLFRSMEMAKWKIPEF